MTTDSTKAHAFTILFVCTGNLCRSPMAEHLTRAALAERGIGPDAVRVVSAGTYAVAGNRMHPHAATALAEHGLSGEDFTARSLTGELVRDADLVLAATREHRARVVRLHPPAAARTFTLGELDRLCDGLDPAGLSTDDIGARGRALVAAAAARRGTVPPLPTARDDLADPIGEPFPSFARCAEKIDAQLRGPLRLLLPPS